MNQYRHVCGLLFIVGGLVMLFFALGDLLFRLVLGFIALSLINYGMRLRGMPPLQLLLPMFFMRRW